MNDKTFHDKIAEVSLNFFKTLPKSGKPTDKEWTVLSSLIQEIDSKLTVVALGTGSKCIGASKMSEFGDILNDSHAEVICRRSFLRYIFDQLNGESLIFNFNKTTNKFILNPKVSFHFFTTHVPCGDASIFPMQNFIDFGDTIKEDVEVPSYKKVKLDKSDLFRTGAKCLEGSEEVDAKLPGINYHITGVVRTKPGRGDRTLSVSCSDKLAKWTHLGMQGALLSNLIETPIYFSSFTIAGNTPFCKDAIKRAFYDRLEPIYLKCPYKQNKITFGQSSIKFEFAKDDNKQPCSSCISWSCIKGKRLEVAVEGKRQGITKKKLNTEAARLKICKLEIFKSFIGICDKIKYTLTNRDNRSLSYHTVKQINKDYQHSWETLRQSFKTWPVKNVFLNFVAK